MQSGSIPPQVNVAGQFITLKRSYAELFKHVATLNELLPVSQVTISTGIVCVNKQIHVFLPHNEAVDEFDCTHPYLHYKMPPIVNDFRLNHS